VLLGAGPASACGGCFHEPLATESTVVTGHRMAMSIVADEVRPLGPDSDELRPDDIAVALVGLHPADVWVARLETQLPRERLDTDLVLEAAPQQSEIANRFMAGLAVNNCWDGERASALPQVLPLGEGGPQLPPGGLGWMMLAGAALALTMRRPRRGSALPA